MKLINQISGMPQISTAFAGWMNNITIVRITQTIVNGFSEDAEEQITFKGTIQPLNPRSIALKPEGQRDWEWLQIHCFAGNLNLVPNDRIIYNSIKYKIMASLDYSLNNYIEYHLVRDYE
jgi:hypothetical protein